MTDMAKQIFFRNDAASVLANTRKDIPMAKIVEPETVDKFFETFQDNLWGRYSRIIMGKEPATLRDRLKAEAYAEAKQSLRQLLLAGVPPEKQLPKDIDNYHGEVRGQILGEALGFNLARQEFVDCINKITE